MPSLDAMSIDGAPIHDAAPQPLDLVRDELMALDPRTLLSLNVDMTSAALVVIGAAPEIRKHEDELVRLVGEEMARPVERLELLARAALQAHAWHRAIESGADLAPLLARVTQCRELLRAEVRSLVARELLPSGVASELTNGQGYKNASFDVLQLVAALRESWGAVHGRTGLRAQDLAEAEAAANQLVTTVGLRDQGARSPSADLRQRAYTLLAETYDDARRLISFLRWKQGDADRIAPSFFQGRSRRRGRPAQSPTETAAAAPAESAPTAAPGMPGGSPFAVGDAAGEHGAG